MFHSGTQRLMTLWADLPDSGRVPARQALDPCRLGPLMAQTFMADRRDDAPAIRFAGGWVERLHDLPMAGADWLGLWCPDSRALVASAVRQTFRESRPVVIVAEAVGPGDLFEVCLAPFRSARGAADRLMGLYQPTGFGGMALRGIGTLTARVAIGVGEVHRPDLHLAAINGRRVA